MILSSKGPKKVSHRFPCYNTKLSRESWGWPLPFKKPWKLLGQNALEGGQVMGIVTSKYAPLLFLMRACWQITDWDLQKLRNFLFVYKNHNFSCLDSTWFNHKPKHFSILKASSLINVRTLIHATVFVIFFSAFLQAEITTIQLLLLRRQKIWASRIMRYIYSIWG